MSLRIRWEGSFFANHSLALVNRELARRVARRPGLDVALCPDATDAGLDWDAAQVAELQALPQVDEEWPADVVVRHRWPMPLHAPRGGAWVAVQPWEFGALPRAWHDPMCFAADEVWVPSTFNKEVFVEAGIPEAKVRVVPNGVHDAFHGPAAPFPLRTRKRVKLLFVGGTIARKGIDVLIDAYVRAFGPDDDVCLVIKDFGVGTYYKHQTYDGFIRELAADPTKPAIEYIDRALTTEELRDLYHACDALVHPYRGEGFGLPIAEAMACGLPVIVTEGGGAADFCTPDTAVLIPGRRVAMPHAAAQGLDTIGHPWWLEPDAKALGERLRDFYGNAGALAEVAARGQALVRARFTWDAAADAAAGALASLAGVTPRRDRQADVHAARMSAGVQAWERASLVEATRHFAVARALEPTADAEYNLAAVLAAAGDLRAAHDVAAALAARAPDDAEAQALHAAASGAMTARTARPRGAGEHPRVRWHGPFFSPFGYADEARGHVLGLHALGFPVRLAPIDAPTRGAFLDRAELDALTGMMGDDAAPDVDVQHLAANIAAVPRSATSVLRTMFETDRLPAEWVDHCNRFTEVWVPTEFNRETFARSGVVEEKLRVVPGAIDAALYETAAPATRARGRRTRFLTVFDWTTRKGWDVLLRAYLEEFRPDDAISLVVKANNFHLGRSPSETVRDFVAGFLERAGRPGTAPHVEVIEGDLSTQQMLDLYRSCDAFVLPSRGEGWGRPYMEAMALGLPTIGTRWSGQLAFMNDDNSYLIEVEGLDPAEQPGMEFYRGHRWARPSAASTRAQMRRVLERPDEAAAIGARARAHILTNFCRRVVAGRIVGELERLAGR